MSSLSPKPFAEVLGLDDDVAEARARRDRDLELVRRVPLGFGLATQLLVRGEARLALGLARLRRHPHPLELALERALAGDIGFSSWARRSCFCSSHDE